MRIVIAAAVCAAVSLPVAADVYKCQSGDGKIEYRSAPCENGRKLETNFNSVDTAPNPAVAAKAKEVDQRIAERLQAGALQRERNAAASDALYRECRGYIDQTARQRPWLGSKSAVARYSAEVEIGIAERKFKDAGCR